MKKFSHIASLLAFGILSFSLFVPEPIASGAQRDRDRICFYTDTDFRGNSTCLNAGESVSSLKSRGWNDRISSIRVYGQASAVLYGDTEFRGGSIDIRQDVRNLKSLGWNDKISSIQVTSGYGDNGYGRRDDRRRDDRWEDRRDDNRNDRRDDWRHNGPGSGTDDGICVYEDTNYRGRSRCFRVGERLDHLTQIDGGIWNDRISSIRVGRGSVTVYSDSEFRGNSRTIDSDIPDLKRLGINDQISSLEVFGGRR